uniref:Serine protease 59 n=1 Tax=Mamestra configurata TaxID=174822 RepID=E7D011_9NEOP|nr:serine protease 59 [Mamestra configurata]
MDFKTGLLVFTFLAGCFAAPTLEAPEDDMAIFFDHTDASSRIVGGTQAAVGSHPHMVALTTGLAVRSFFCGGSLITQRTILTAAHCIRGVFSWGSLTSSLRATVGTNRWNSGGTTYSIARNVTHPHYVHNIIKNDIGILITSSNVALNNLVRTVPITYSVIPGGVRSRVAGWGRIRAGGALSANLLELFPTTLAGSDCEDRIARAAVQFNSPRAHVQSHIEICTFQATNFGTCNGDSGSALLRADNGQQFGIVSWGFPCALGVPDMFVRISAYQNWLRANVV